MMYHQNENQHAAHVGCIDEELCVMAAAGDREAEEKIKRAVHELDPRYFAIVQIDKSYVR